MKVLLPKEIINACANLSLLLKVQLETDGLLYFSGFQSKSALCQSNRLYFIVMSRVSVDYYMS